MERKTTTVCSYRKCNNSYNKKKGIRMFRFPKHLSKEWVNNCDETDMRGLSIETTENFSSESESEQAMESDGAVLQRRQTTTLEDCSQVYFAGYLAHSYYKKQKCMACLKKMCDLDSKLSSKKELLLLNRAFSNFKVDPTSGLFSPSENLEHVVNTALKLFKNRFSKIGHKLNLVKRLVRITKSVVSLDSLTCVACQDHSDFVIKTMFRVLIHEQCKWISNDFKNSALGKLKILKNV